MRILLFCLIIWYPFMAFAQEGLITGVVRSGANPVPFANVGIRGTALGAVTSEDGRFTIKVPLPGKFIVQVSYVGYESVAKEVILTNSNPDAEISFHILPAVTSLNELVVTGTRSEKRRLDSAVPVNVIDSRVLEASHAITLADGLSYTSGVRVEKDCQTCNYSQVRMNGLPGSYSQILINSRPLFSSLAGLYGLEQFPASMIERVEIVKGGGSVLFGSSAIGGTINIITKDPSENTFEFNSTASTIDASGEDWQADGFTSFVNMNRTAGISAIISAQQRQPWDANNDGFSELPQIENLSAGINSFIRTSASSRVGISLNRIKETRNGGDQLMKEPHLRLQSEFRDSEILAGNVDFSKMFYGSRIELMLYTGAQQTLREHYTGSFGVDGYGDTKNYTLMGGVQVSHTLLKFLTGKNKITSGVEYQHEYTFDAIPAYNYLLDQETFQWGMYLQSDWDISNRLNFVSGLRASVQNTTDDIIYSPRFNVLYKVTPEWQLRAGRSEGFRSPQAFDTDMHIAFAGGGVALTIIDPALTAEKSVSYSGSIDYNKASSKYIYGWSVSGFHTSINNIFILEDAGNNGDNTILLRTNGGSGIVKGITAETRFNYNYKIEGDLGFTFQQNMYDKPVKWSDEAPASREFMRTPACYGYFALRWQATKNLKPSLTGIYTGPMYVPHLAGAPGVTADVVTKSNPFMEVGIKTAYTLPLVSGKMAFTIVCGIHNILNAFQDDFDSGPGRDSNYIYGPGRPRTLFAGLKLEMLKN